MTPNQLADNVSDGHNTCLISGDVIYFVDHPGNVTPTARQCTREYCYLFLNHKDPHAPFKGYICAQQNGACRCSDLVANLDDCSHLRPRSAPYVIAADFGEYRLIAVSRPVGPSLTPFATNGDLHVGPNGGEPVRQAASRAPRAELPPEPEEDE